MRFFLLLISIYLTNGWHFHLKDFNFQSENLLFNNGGKLKRFDSLHKTNSWLWIEFDVKVFESVYLENDYFNLLSNTKSDYIGQNEKFILVGARYILRQYNLFFSTHKNHIFVYLGTIYTT